jgi:hypothetical protein
MLAPNEHVRTVGDAHITSVTEQQRCVTAAWYGPAGGGTRSVSHSVPSFSALQMTARSWLAEMVEIVVHTYPEVRTGRSGAYGPVDTLTQEIRVPVVAAVLQEHVHHHHPQRNVFTPPRLMPTQVQGLGLSLDAA